MVRTGHETSGEVLRPSRFSHHLPPEPCRAAFG